MQDSNLDFYYIADLDNENLLYSEELLQMMNLKINNLHIMSHLLKIQITILIPENFYQLSGKEQIANSSTFRIFLY